MIFSTSMLMWHYSIHRSGKVGQMVIYGERVNWGVNPDPTKNPLSQYTCPSFFTIVEKQEGENGYYILKDAKGNSIKVTFDTTSWLLYDLQEWLTWNDLCIKEELSCKQRQIKQLENHEKLLKDILINQGIRIVTESQAKELGLN